jgi:hypothetical protein
LFTQLPLSQRWPTPQGASALHDAPESAWQRVQLRMSTGSSPSERSLTTLPNPTRASLPGSTRSLRSAYPARSRAKWMPWISAGR